MKTVQPDGWGARPLPPPRVGGLTRAFDKQGIAGTEEADTFFFGEGILIRIDDMEPTIEAQATLGLLHVLDRCVVLGPDSFGPEEVPCGKVILSRARTHEQPVDAQALLRTILRGTTDILRRLTRQMPDQHVREQEPEMRIQRMMAWIGLVGRRIGLVCRWQVLEHPAIVKAVPDLAAIEPPRNAGWHEGADAGHRRLYRLGQSGGALGQWGGLRAEIDEPEAQQPVDADFGQADHGPGHIRRCSATPQTDQLIAQPIGPRMIGTDQQFDMARALNQLVPAMKADIVECSDYAVPAVAQCSFLIENRTGCSGAGRGEVRGVAGKLPRSEEQMAPFQIHHRLCGTVTGGQGPVCGDAGNAAVLSEPARFEAGRYGGLPARVAMRSSLRPAAAPISPPCGKIGCAPITALCGVASC